MRLYLAFVGLTVLLLTGCTGASGSSTPTPGFALPTLTRGPTPIPGLANIQRNRPFGLRIGQEGVFSEANITIRFVAVAEDSRCPRAVDCVWSGQAVVRVALRSAGQDLGEQNLSYIGRDTTTEQSTLILDGAILRFVALEPYPEQPISIAPEEYVATFIFE